MRCMTSSDAMAAPASALSSSSRICRKGRRVPSESGSSVDPGPSPTNASHRSIPAMLSPCTADRHPGPHVQRIYLISCLTQAPQQITLTNSVSETARESEAHSQARRCANRRKCPSSVSENLNREHRTWACTCTREMRPHATRTLSCSCTTSRKPESLAPAAGGGEWLMSYQWRSPLCRE